MNLRAASDSNITITTSIVTSSFAVDFVDTFSTAKSNTQPSKQSWLKIIVANHLDKPLNQIKTDKLFERFYRHDKTSQHHSGSGLGLSIVQAIANAHKGTVSITIKDEYYFEVTVGLLIARSQTPQYSSVRNMNNI